MFRKSKTCTWEKNEHNGCYDQHIELKMIHVPLILSNNMSPKFQVIILITDCFIACFVSDIIFAHKERLTLEVKLTTFPKVSFLEKNMILAVWVYASSWKFHTTIWHYLAIFCQIFRVVSLFLTDWEHVSWVTFFLAHLVLALVQSSLAFQSRK